MKTLELTEKTKCNVIIDKITKLFNENNDIYAIIVSPEVLKILELSSYVETIDKESRKTRVGYLIVDKLYSIKIYIICDEYYSSNKIGIVTNVLISNLIENNINETIIT